MTMSRYKKFVTNKNYVEPLSSLLEMRKSNKTTSVLLAAKSKL